METTFYVQFSATKTAGGKIASVVVRNVTQNPPTDPGSNVVVKMTLDIPEAAFLPLEATPMKVEAAKMVDAQAGVLAIAKDLTDHLQDRT